MIAKFHFDLKFKGGNTMKQVPEKNDIVTAVSTIHADRSFSDAIWKVVAVNATHAKIKWVGGDKYWEGCPPRIVALRHYQFSLADEFMGDEDE
jgi:hypothetical protein